ncbi:MAG: tetratricopeptide repeat protein [Bryobacteraceae bacterium]
MPAVASKPAYSREAVLRVLGISERQLKAWEAQKLLEPRTSFGFTDMLALRTLVKLRNDKVPAARIRQALTALRQRLAGVSNPLTELKLYADAGRVRVEIDGQRMEPVTGQLLLDYDQSEIRRLLAFPKQPSGQHIRRQEAAHWFEKGLELEQTGAPVEDVIEAYRKAVSLDPHSAGALVNLGTIYFNALNWEEAEKCYLQALQADEKYALAHFNLGNLYDEKRDRAKALHHYRSALSLNANYADAHYNLALLYQSIAQPMGAVRHWTAYLKLDRESNWATIARRELDKLRHAAVVPGVRRP